MTADTPREFERIHWLFHEFRDAITRGGISRQAALDALEYTLEDFLSEVCDSEEHVKQYFEILRDRVVRAWRRQTALVG
jgi:hypothetical protein